MRGALVGVELHCCCVDRAYRGAARTTPSLSSYTSSSSSSSMYSSVVYATSRCVTGAVRAGAPALRFSRAYARYRR